MSDIHIILSCNGNKNTNADLTHNLTNLFFFSVLPALVAKIAAVAAIVYLEQCIFVMQQTAALLRLGFFRVFLILG